MQREPGDLVNQVESQVKIEEEIEAKTEPAEIEVKIEQSIIDIKIENAESEVKSESVNECE